MPASLRRSFATSLLLVGALALSGCGLRFDNPPDQLPHLDPGQAGISAATRAQEAISTAAENLSSDASLSPDLRAIAGSVRDQAAARLEAMGGLWTPWPSGSPTGASPGPTPLAVPENLNHLVQLLLDSGTAACNSAALAPRPTDAQLLAAVCAASLLDANHLAAAGKIAPEETGKTTQTPTKPQPDNPETPMKKITDRSLLEKMDNACAALDFARYRMETAASRLRNEDRNWALSRANNLAWDVDTLVRLGAKDVRSSQYALDFSQLRDQKAAIRLLNQADSDAFAAHLDVIGLLPPASKNQENLRDTWISAVKEDVFSQGRFGVESSQIFSQLWP